MARFLTDEQVAEACRKYQETEPKPKIKDLAAEFGCHRQTMAKILKDKGIKVSLAHPENRSGKYTVKVTPKQLAQIRYLYEEVHLTQEELAEQIGLTRGVVNYIFHREGIPIRHNNTSRRLKRERKAALARYTEKL